MGEYKVEETTVKFVGLLSYYAHSPRVNATARKNPPICDQPLYIAETLKQIMAFTKFLHVLDILNTGKIMFTKSNH